MFNQSANDQAAAPPANIEFHLPGLCVISMSFHLGDCIVQGYQGEGSTIGHHVMPQGAVLLSSECDQIPRKAT